VEEAESEVRFLFLTSLSYPFLPSENGLTLGMADIYRNAA